MCRNKNVHPPKANGTVPLPQVSPLAYAPNAGLIHNNCYKTPEDFKHLCSLIEKLRLILIELNKTQLILY